MNTFIVNAGAEANRASLKALMRTPPMDQKTHEAILKSRVMNRRRSEDLRMERALQGDLD